MTHAIEHVRQRADARQHAAAVARARQTDDEPRPDELVVFLPLEARNVGQPHLAVGRR